MTRFLAGIAAAAAIFALVFSVLSFIHSDPDTSTLDADIQIASQHVGDAEADLRSVSGGAIQAVTQLRVALLKTTLDMLQQKRSSLIRRIDLRYVINGNIRDTDTSKLSEISGKISEQLAKAAGSERDAALYSGGLLQSLDLITAATAKLTAAQLQLSYFSEKYGTPIFAASVSASAAPSVGKTVKDNSAL